MPHDRSARIVNNHKTFYTLTFPPNHSSWQPNGFVNTQIRRDANLVSNWKYRSYIQNNANQIMKYNTMEYIYASGNNPYLNSDQKNNYKTPHLFNGTQETIHGEKSDLAQNFLNKQFSQTYLVAPSIPTQR